MFIPTVSQDLHRLGRNLEEVLADEVDLRLEVVECLAPVVEDLGQDGGDVQLPLDLQLGEAKGFAAGQLLAQLGGLHQAPGEQRLLHADERLLVFQEY